MIKSDAAILDIYALPGVANDFLHNYALSDGATSSPFKTDALYDNGKLCNAALWHDRQGVKMPAATTCSINKINILIGRGWE